MIPALDEEASIASVVGSIARSIVRDVIVVDNGSTDSTAARARAANAIRTNLTGPFFCSRAFVRGLRAAQVRGKIVNISSVHEEIPRAGASEYCASKGGLRNLTRCLALELAP